jgi:putative transposon-encoded protein
MDQRQKLLMKQIYNLMFKGDIAQIIEKKVDRVGKHVIIVMPSKFLGRTVKVIIYNNRSHK